MIISGGVNIYPQECEDLLIPHPKVFDAAVFGFQMKIWREVKAVVQPIDGIKGVKSLQKNYLIIFLNIYPDRKYRVPLTTLIKYQDFPLETI